jgi:hypothetical protein
MWRGLALLPGDLPMYLWAYAGAAASFLLVALLIVRCHPRLYPGLMALFPYIATTAWSGNVNALLIPVCAAVWWAYSRGRPSLAGSLVGVACVLKLMPGLLIWWFVVRRDSRALAACLATVAVALILSSIGAGPDSFLQYLAVAREAGTISLPPLSPTALATHMGAPAALAYSIPYLLAASAAALVWRWRDRPSWAFAACGVGVTLGTPGLRMEVLGWLLLAFVPFANDPAPWFRRRRLSFVGWRRQPARAERDGS